MPGIILSQSVIKSLVVLGLLLAWFIFLVIAVCRTYKHFSKKEALKIGWQMALKNLSFFIPFLIVQCIVFHIPEIITSLATEQFKIPGLSLEIFPIDKASAYTWIMFVLKLIVMAFVATSFISTALSLLDNKKVSLQKVFTDRISVKNILFFVIACLIYKLLVVLGLFILVIPGIIIGVMFSLWPLYMVDKGYGPIKSLTASLKTVQGINVLDVFLFIVLCSAINVLGLLVLGVGLFITIPLTLIAFTHVYRKLSMSSHA